MFTDGKDRSFESLMQQTPYYMPRYSGKRQSDFRYRYADMDCEYCTDKKSCEYSICPYIIDNLDDLMSDKAFVQAVENAESCENRHKQTLLMLKRQSAER